MLLTIFHEIPDHRRAQGKMYDLPHLLLCTVLAILCDADSYRAVHSFITMRFKTLQASCGLAWKRPPAYSTIRHTIQGMSAEALERAFRAYAARLAEARPGTRRISLDGKTVRGSFDHFHDKKAVQVFSALFGHRELILAHEFIEGNKTNEIPIAQQLIKELGLSGCLFTADAMHCQKKR